jgi:formylmethanofuran dehydrogenase subunit E
MSDSWEEHQRLIQMANLPEEPYEHESVQERAWRLLESARPYAERAPKVSVTPAVEPITVMKPKRCSACSKVVQAGVTAVKVNDVMFCKACAFVIVEELERQ